MIALVLTLLPVVIVFNELSEMFDKVFVEPSTLLLVKVFVEVGVTKVSDAGMVVPRTEVTFGSDVVVV